MRRAALRARPVGALLRMGALYRARSWGFPSSWYSTPTGYATTRTGRVIPWSCTHRYCATTTAPCPGLVSRLWNASRPKGADLFYELARRFPDRTFLAVRGTWGDQLEPSSLPNVTLVGPITDMRSVYSRTRVLLMPSTAESYGRVGLEAAASGIPTIASDLPGLREALGDSALYAASGDIDAWIGQLCALDDARAHMQST